MGEKLNNFLSVLKTFCKSNIWVVVVILVCILLGAIVYISMAQSKFFNKENQPEYNAYIKSLENVCSRNKLEEGQYKDCLYRLIESKEDEAFVSYNKLAKEVNSKEDLLSSLNDLYKTWDTYHNALCWSSSVDDQAEKNSWYPLVTCELYQTKLFSDVLFDLREEWIRD